MKLAKRADVPIIPVALKTDFQQPGRLCKDFGPVDRSKTIRFEFGGPITVTGNGKETHKEIVQFIVTRLRQWGAEVSSQ